jgi:regulatory protein
MKTCRDSALKLLAVKARTEKELVRLLSDRGYGQDIIDETVLFLKARHIIDDLRFARDYAEYVERRNPSAVANIRAVLESKGIESGIIEKVTEGLDDGATVKKVALDRFKRVKGLPRDKARKRVYDYLLRRGFTHDAAESALKEIDGD